MLKKTNERLTTLENKVDLILARLNLEYQAAHERSHHVDAQLKTCRQAKSTKKRNYQQKQKATTKQREAF